MRQAETRSGPLGPWTALRRWLAVVAITACAGACGDDPFQVIEETEFAPSLGIDLAEMERLPSGVYIEDIVVGTGDTLTVGRTATVDYTAWLADGHEFGSSDIAPLPPFTLGVHDLIDGFEIGVEGMLVGGIRRIIIPPELGYGDAEQGAIPAGSVLIFEVELLTVETETEG